MTATAGIDAGFRSSYACCPCDIVYPRHHRAGSGSSEEGVLHALEFACSIQNFAYGIPCPAEETARTAHFDSRCQNIVYHIFIMMANR